MSQTQATCSEGQKSSYRSLSIIHNVRTPRSFPETWKPSRVQTAALSSCASSITLNGMTVFPRLLLPLQVRGLKSTYHDTSVYATDQHLQKREIAANEPAQVLLIHATNHPECTILCCGALTPADLNVWICDAALSVTMGTRGSL